MAIYEYFCQKCDKEFEIVMSIHEYSELRDKIQAYDSPPAECPTCRNISTNRVISSKIQFIGTAVESPEYNPGLGTIVKNSKHRKELAKERGLIEIGNEKPENIHKKCDNDLKEKIKKSWDDI